MHINEIVEIGMVNKLDFKLDNTTWWYTKVNTKKFLTYNDQSSLQGIQGLNKAKHFVVQILETTISLEEKNKRNRKCHERVFHI